METAPELGRPSLPPTSNVLTTAHKTLLALTLILSIPNLPCHLPRLFCPTPPLLPSTFAFLCHPSHGPARDLCPCCTHGPERSLLHFWVYTQKSSP